MEDNKTKNVGELLKEAREEQNIDLKEVSSAINIRVAQLQAIENSKIDELPGMVYAIGFVKSYAAYLGFNSDEMVTAFKQEHGAAEPANTEIEIEPSIQAQQMPNYKILLISAIVIIAIFATWSFVFTDKTANQANADMAIPEPSKELKAKIIEEEKIAENQTKMEDNVKDKDKDKEEYITADDNKKSNIDASSKTAVAQREIKPKTTKKPRGKSFGVSSKHSRITLKAIASSWVHINDKGGKTVFRKVLRPGQIYRVPNIKNLTLTTANAGGLEVYVDGKKLKAFGKRGDIIRGIELNPDKILQKNKP